MISSALSIDVLGKHIPAVVWPQGRAFQIPRNSKRNGKQVWINQKQRTSIHRRPAGWLFRGVTSKDLKSRPLYFETVVSVGLGSTQACASQAPRPNHSATFLLNVCWPFTITLRSAPWNSVTCLWWTRQTRRPPTWPASWRAWWRVARWCWETGAGLFQVCESTIIMCRLGHFPFD